MASFGVPALREINKRLGDASLSRFFLAFVPAIVLSGFWFGIQGVLIVLSALLPVLYLARGVPRPLRPRQKMSHLTNPAEFDIVLDDAQREMRDSGAQSLLLCLEVEEIDRLMERYGTTAVERMMHQVGLRLARTLRREDRITHRELATFDICTTTMPRLDLETSIQLSGRVQTALEEPFNVDGIGLYVTAAVGFCPAAQAPKANGSAWHEAARHALAEARRYGPGAIRAFTSQMRQTAQTEKHLREEAFKALENGQIIPWFQPQISTDTGRITGFEALARWKHPDHGMIPPADFLPAIEENGQLEHLAETMIAGAFDALQKWDRAGVDVPRVGVNFAGPELSNPRLAEKVQWELDRFNLNPDRLAVEILETVVGNTQDDVIARNIRVLQEMGCCVDLDDFGTGHASIASIRRFSVSRIKIDRSFVMKADRDPEQQRMISAILTMAEQLQIETLAEGVETAGEHALLSQLGCHHVQGFGIARPMPFEETLAWITAHQQKLDDVPRITKGSGA
jgi:EAL domain-containing protein (putative c-di-GMP-specific phosphodiesterase class I)/GGDEF domain-containing protein